MVPTSYHDEIDAGFFDEPPEPDTCVPVTLNGIPAFPYLDSRYIEESQADLTRFQRAGIRGLKVLYIPEEDRENGMIGWERLFGRSRVDSEDLTAPPPWHRPRGSAGRLSFTRTFAVTAGSWRTSWRPIPTRPSSFPTSGSRARRWRVCWSARENVYTDFSSLLPFMKKAPEAYESFIRTYADRVLFGTDTTVGCPGLTEEYIAFVPRILPDEEVRRKVLVENYLRIHGT